MGKITKTAKVEKKKRLKETQGVPLPLNKSLKRRRRIDFRRIEAIHQHTSAIMLAMYRAPLWESRM